VRIRITQIVPDMNLLTRFLTGLFIVVLFCLCSDDQDLDRAVRITDSQFRAVLIDEGVDSNNDGIISVGEAEEVYYLHFAGDLCIDCEGGCWNRLEIKSLAGIEAFKNLTRLTFWCTEIENLNLPELPKLTDLSCFGNWLKSLDVSQCRALRSLDVFGNQLSELDLSQNEDLVYLSCFSNSLTKLDLSNNPNLDFLDCSSNKLIALDITDNPALTDLRCSGNLLEAIDISQNPSITTFSCGWNQLSSLNLSNNIELTYIELSGMSTLYNVCVWELPFPPSGVELYHNDSPNINFTMDCN